MTSLAPLETLAIHWCKWGFTRAIGVNDTNGVNGAIYIYISIYIYITFTLASLAIQWCKWQFIGVIDTIGVNYANAPMTPVASLISMCNGACEMWKTHRHSMMPLVPMRPLEPLVPYCQCRQWNYFPHRHHCRHWIQCRHWRYCQHCHHCIIIFSNGSSLSPLVPPTFIWYLNLHIATKWRQWSHLKWSIYPQWWSSLEPMVIVIGANGDGVHCHWRQWIAISAIFCRHWRKWRRWR